MSKNRQKNEVNMEQGDLSRKERRRLRKEQKKLRNQEKKQRKKRRPRLPQVIYVAALIGAIIYVSNRGGALSYALFYTMLFYPVLAFFYLLIVRAAIRIQQDLPARELKKRVDESYHLAVENTSFLPVSGVRLFIEPGRADFRDDITGEELSLLPREKRSFDTSLHCNYTGSYETGIARITFRDAFHLMRLNMEVPMPLRVQILPVVTGIAKDDLSRATWSLTRGSMGGRRNEKEEILGNDMAQYTPGDPLKRIHWKNYARSGEAMVRIPEDKDFSLITLLLQLQPGSMESLEVLARRDKFLTYSVSVAGAFAEQKKPVQVLFYNAAVKRVLVEDYEGLEHLCRELSKELVQRDDPEKVEALLREEAERWQCPTLIIKEGEEQLCPM